jgi:DNA-binding transcriptional ArsR family regulator
MPGPKRWAPARAIVPRPVLELSELRGDPKLLWGIMAEFARNSGWCYASEETLAAILGRSQRTVRRYLRLLEGARLIESHLRPGRTPAYRVNLVKAAVLPANEGGQICPPQTGQNCPPPRTGMSADNRDLSLGHVTSGRILSLTTVPAQPTEPPHAFPPQIGALISVLQHHANHLHPPRNVEDDTRLIQQILQASGNRPLLAASIIQRIMTQRFDRPAGQAQPWPKSLGYWIQVVREETHKILCGPKTK